ncbi:hypothetical protein [uncultured Bifidobacterium sp.]|uniref:hypothetical protein n=1 Tax=uncultured Bifidobacterium sp. TaxID=165187 RepID=UPI00259AAC1F|nr:hypothetical protein [uncultured Bifidobacterium sp.]
MKQIIIASPSNKVTGGTELLQQLCFTLRNAGFPCKMWYEKDCLNNIVQNYFNSIYHNESTSLHDTFNNIIIIPETMTYLLNRIKRAERVIWWLSVDNYSAKNVKGKNIFRHAFQRIVSKVLYEPIIRKCDNLVQSKYAEDFLLNELGVSADKIHFCSDYLNSTFIEGALKKDILRYNHIAYNPAKISPFLKKLIQEVTEYEWIPLQGLDVEGMQETLSSCKIYVDFGPHPGKDRIPREAAICGCCVITGRRGSAANNFDVPIPIKYKFDEYNQSVTDVHNCISLIMNDYEKCKHDFDDYRKIIECEENTFKIDAISFFERKV